MAAAAEKLAECQETISLLGKQLQTLRPQMEQGGSPYSERSSKADDGLTGEEPTISNPNLQDLDELDSASSTSVQRLGPESPLYFSNNLCPSDNEANHTSISPAKNPKHRPTKSASSSSVSSVPTPDKMAHGRGFSRFFSSKGKNGR